MLRGLRAWGLGLGLGLGLGSFRVSGLLGCVYDLRFEVFALI